MRRISMEAIFTRRSVRSYSDEPVEKEKIDKLLRAGMQAPSAMNKQPWEFLVIQSKKTLMDLSKMSMFAKMVASASLAIILLGDYREGQSQKFFPQDMSAASENILLEATELNLGAVWLGVHPISQRQKYIKDLFKLPEGVIPFSVIAIGYPKNKESNKFVDRYHQDKVHFERY